jgi:hypothetical protein
MEPLNRKKWAHFKINGQDLEHEMAKHEKKLEDTFLGTKPPTTGSSLNRVGSG